MITSLFLQICLAIFVSSIIWVILFVSIFSSGIIDLGLWGSWIAPVSQTVTHGLIVGIPHGLILGLIILLRKPDSILGLILSSIAASEIFLVFAFVGFFTVTFLVPLVKRRGVMGEPLWEYLYGMVFLFITYYLIFSIVFLIPSVVIGIINRLPAKFLFDQIR